MISPNKRIDFISVVVSLSVEKFMIKETMFCLIKLTKHIVE